MSPFSQQPQKIQRDINQPVARAAARVGQTGAVKRPASTRTDPANRPVLQPWEAADLDPEHLGDWGTKADQPAGMPRRGTRRLVLIGMAVAIPIASLAVWHSLRPSTPATPYPVSHATSTSSVALAREAASTARAFLAADTIEKRVQFVRHPEVTRGRMQSWHSDHRPLVAIKALNFHDRSEEATVGSQTFLMLYFETADYATRAIALEKVPGGGFLVDWESFEAWSEIPWLEFVGTEPLTPCEFRVVIERDTYFNFSYSDADVWLCFKLSDPANRAHCWGYCRIDSEVASALDPLMRRQLQQGTSEAKAILRLRFDDSDPGRRQVLIDAVIQDNWVKLGP